MMPVDSSFSITIRKTCEKLGNVPLPIGVGVGRGVAAGVGVGVGVESGGGVGRVCFRWPRPGCVRASTVSVTVAVKTTAAMAETAMVVFFMGTHPRAGS